MSGNSKEGCIVLAEDNPGDVYLAKLALRDNGLKQEICTVEDGESALAFVKQLETTAELQVALVLLDLHLPKIDGLEVLRHLRAGARGRHVPVMILTSSDSPEHRKSAEGFERVSFFRKPCSLDDFLVLGSIARNLIEDGSDSQVVSAGAHAGHGGA